MPWVSFSHPVSFPVIHTFLVCAGYRSTLDFVWRTVAIGVEAAGIEPASRDIFMKASTHIVDCLILARVDSNRQDATRSSRSLQHVVRYTAFVF